MPDLRGNYDAGWPICTAPSADIDSPAMRVRKVLPKSDIRALQIIWSPADTKQRPAILCCHLDQSIYWTDTARPDIN